jgi:P pilus assembly chaperone PapD
MKKLIGIMLFAFISVPKANGVAITQKKFLIDSTQSTEMLRVLNVENVPQTCEVSVGGTQVNSDGLLEISDSVGQIKDLVRFAPRRFNIRPGEHQNVRLQYRRKPNTEPGEHLGLLALKCSDMEYSVQGQVQIKPQLVHHMPIIARVGNLNVKAEISSAKKVETGVDVTLAITGNRSLVGQFEVTNKSTGEVIFTSNDKTIYPQKPVKTFSLEFIGGLKAPLLIQFKENSKFGGNLIIDKNVD